MLPTIAMVATVLCGSSFLFFLIHMIAAERRKHEAKAAVCCILMLTFALATLCAGLTWNVLNHEAHARWIVENAPRERYAVLAIDSMETGIKYATLAAENGRRISLAVPVTTVAGDTLTVACEEWCEVVQ